MHLAIDGYGEDTKALEDPGVVRSFLDRYPATIGTTKLMEPHVLTYHSPKPEDWGVSGFVIIAESHISVHTFPQRNYINVDIFSCRDFDTQKALQDVKETFRLTIINSWSLDRGLEHYSPEQARRALDLERERLTHDRAR